MILAFTQLLSQRICMGYSRQIQENGKWAESCTSPWVSSLLQLGAWERMKRWFANGRRSMAWTSHFEHSLLPLFHPLRFAPTSPPTLWFLLQRCAGQGAAPVKAMGAGEGSPPLLPWPSPADKAELSHTFWTPQGHYRLQIIFSMHPCDTYCYLQSWGKI